jgi:hypothetical protein
MGEYAALNVARSTAMPFQNDFDGVCGAKTQHKGSQPKKWVR